MRDENRTPDFIVPGEGFIAFPLTCRARAVAGRRTMEACMLRWCALALALLLAGCGEQDAQQAIEASGFSDVALSAGVVFWGCDSKSDSVFMNHSFTAKAANGHRVEGVACGGVLKGYTVRIMKVLP